MSSINERSNTTTLAGKGKKTHSHTLTRVRNNQRRHRQRRREYIEFLEKKLEESETLLGQAHADIAGLKAELEGLKRRSSLNDDYSDGWADSTSVLEDFCQSTSSRPMVGENLSTTTQRWKGATIDGFGTISGPRPESTIDGVLATITPTSEIAASRLPTISPNSIMDLSVLTLAPSLEISSTPGIRPPEPPPGPLRGSFPPQWPLTIDAPPTITYADALSPYSMTQTPLDPTFPPVAGETYPAGDEQEMTNLCSQAYFLIAQQNFRGLDAITIRNWLFHGFRRARVEEEGCRVENGILFSLLDFISGA